MRQPTILLGALCLLLLAPGCNKDHAEQPTGARDRAAERLKPLTGAIEDSWKRGRSYVPVYSSVDWGFDNRLVDLAVTLSVRNVAAKQDVVIESVDYYDSSGARVRHYLDKPAVLPGMASVEFVIAQRDRTGGTGANFVVDWAIPADGEDPLIEAVMVGQHGNAGISFTSPARAIRRVK